MDNILHHGIFMNIKFSPNIFCVILAHKVLTRLIQLWVSNWQPFPHTPLGITHLHLSFSSFSWIIDTSTPSKHPPPNQLQKWYLQSAGIWHCPRKELEKGPSVFLSISFCRFQSYPCPTRLCCVVPCELYKIVWPVSVLVVHDTVELGWERKKQKWVLRTSTGILKRKELLL